LEQAAQFILSQRVQAIKESPTLAVTARAAKLKSEGKDIIGLGAGEPDFDTPQHIKDAAKQAIDNGFTKYTPVAGIPGLKKAIVAKFKHHGHQLFQMDNFPKYSVPDFMPIFGFIFQYIHNALFIK